MRTWSVHIRPTSTAPDGAAVFIKNGFCWPGLLFTLFWALFHRMWLVAAWLVAAAVVIAVVDAMVGLHPAVTGALQAGVTVGLGLVGNDLRRLSLERGGHVERAVVVARSMVRAEQRYFTNIMTPG